MRKTVAVLHGSGTCKRRLGFGGSRLARFENQGHADYTAQGKNQSGNCEQFADHREWRVGDPQHEDPQQNERDTARPSLSAQPDPRWASKRISAPGNQRNSENHPRGFARIGKDLIRQPEPHHQTAEQHKNQLDHHANQLLRPQHPQHISKTNNLRRKICRGAARCAPAWHDLKRFRTRHRRFVLAGGAQLRSCTRLRRTFIVTGVFGRSPESRGTFEILSAMSCPSTTSPKIECLLSSHGVAATVRKNWLPFVPGPEFAIESFPALECFSEG